MSTWLPLVLAIGLPLLFVGRMVKGAALNRRLHRDGVVAKATVMEVHGTGMKINNQPVCTIVLRVEPAGEPPFEATARQVVPLTSLGELRRGAVVTARYDPRDRAKVALGAIGYVEVSRAEGEAMAQSAQRLLAELNAPGVGVAAPALVRAFSPTGVEVNGPNPLARVEVKVMPADSAPFDATIVGVFGAAGLHKYQPGQEVAVRFDPSNRARVTLDLSRTMARTS